jgi:TPP-dependent pyruvate/acetoin dehydrogenase alpha subunit
LKQSPLGHDCLKLAEDFLLKKNFTDAAQIAVWRSEAVREIEDAVSQVQREPSPNPFIEDWTALSSAHLREAHDKIGN